MAPSEDAGKPEGSVLQLATTKTNTNTNSSDGGSLEVDDKIHEAYDLGTMRGKPRLQHYSPPSSLLGNRRDGHQRLASGPEDDFERQASSAAAQEPAEHADGPVGGSNEGDGIVYKTYKRRWFGLLQLTLLNIVVSWDVSISMPTLTTDKARPAAMRLPAILKR